MQRSCSALSFLLGHRGTEARSMWELCLVHCPSRRLPRAACEESSTSDHFNNVSSSLKFRRNSPRVNRTPPTRCPCRASVSPQSFSGLPEPLRLTYTQPATATRRSQGQTKGERESGAGTLGRWAPWPYRCHWAPKGPKNPLPASAAAGQTGSKIWRCKMSVSKWT